MGKNTSAKPAAAPKAPAAPKAAAKPAGTIPARVRALMPTHKQTFIDAVNAADKSKSNGYKNSLANCYQAGSKEINEESLAAVVSAKIHYGLISADILN